MKKKYLFFLFVLWGMNSVSLAEGRHSVAINSGDCSGTLISSNLVLTAAHCVQYARRWRAYVAFGENSQRPIAKRKIVKALPHKYYGKGEFGTTMNDLAIIQFAGGLPSGFEAVNLVPKNTYFSFDDELIFMGFGVERNNSRRKGHLKVIHTEVNHPSHDSFGTEMRVKQVSGQEICPGDSGGSLFVKSDSGQLLLAAVVAGGVKKTSRHRCGKDYIVATLIPAHYDWISRFIENSK